jgi:hypothetical protein
MEIIVDMEKDEFLGWISIFLGILYLIFLTIKGSGGIVDLVVIFAFFYIPFKTLYKKEKLTKSERMAAILIFVIAWTFALWFYLLTG